jgi:hypothetical protein
MQRLRTGGIVVGAAGRGLCLFCLCMAFVGVTGCSLHAQKTHEDLPPLPPISARRDGSDIVDAKRRRTSFDELQLLVPVTPLFCWSHSAMENPQGSRRNAEGNELIKDGALQSETAMDPIVGPVVRPRRDR